MTDLRGEDPGRWGHSLANLEELLIPLLEAVGATSVAEVGAYAGDLTRDLLDWAVQNGARVIAIDPKPQPELIELSESHDGLELIRAPSDQVLFDLAPVDAVIIDGDHNYYTVSEELRMIGERLSGGDGPLVILHDVCWPHGRRDAYYDPDRIPGEARQPLAPGGGLFPGEPGIVPGAVPYKWVAQREGGPRNGVLTALEDFLAANPELRAAVVPAFFGLGVLWHSRASWAPEVEKLVSPWDRNAIVARLEANRVYHLARGQTMKPEIDHLRRLNESKSTLLSGLLRSRAFSLAERLARLRGSRGAPTWRQQIERLLAEDDR